MDQGHWIGRETDIEKYFGFIYLIQCKVDGIKYIGKKQYWISKAGVVGCKSKVYDRQSPKWKCKCWKESNWKKYLGSSKHLSEHIKLHGKENFVCTILSQHRSRASLYYEEVRQQVIRDVLRSRTANNEYEYFNRQIAAVKFRPPIGHSDIGD